MKGIKNVSYTFIGNIVAALVKWLILVLIVRITNPEMVGFYTFAISISAPIMLFANMRLRLRYVVEDNLSFESLKKLRLMLDIVCILILLVITMIFLKEYVAIVFLIAITKTLDLDSELYYGALQRISDFKSISLMMIGKYSIVFLMFGLTLLVTQNIYISLVIQIIVQAFWLLLIERKSENSIDMKHESMINKEAILLIFTTSLPLGFVQLINSYNILIPRYVIEGSVSLKAVGIFASISYLLTIMDLFMNAISQNFILNIKQSINEGKIKELKKFLNINILAISIVMGLFTVLSTMLLGKFIITLIYGDEYASSSIVLVIISFSIIFNFQSWMFDSALMAFQVYKYQLIVSIITLIISLATSVILIPKFELVGAATSVVIICAIQAIAKWILVNLKFKKWEAR